MNQLTINNTVIEIFVGDIINADYDAIAVPTNSRLLPSGTLRCRVLKGAGHTVQVECNRIISEISNVPIGEAIITSGGNLSAKFIIHVRAGHDQRKLMLAIWNSLKLADKEGIRSIAYPPMSKEVIGFNAKICAGIIIPTIKKFVLERNNNLGNISVCLESLPDYKDFENALDNIAELPGILT